MFELGITTEQVIGYLLVFARVGAWVWLTPPFGGPFLPPQVRVLTGLAFAIPMTPGAIAASGGISLDPLNLLFQFAIQIAIGVALGLVCLILLSAVQSAGAVIDVTGGFAANGTNTCYRGTTYTIILAGFSTTFEVLPIGSGLSTELTAMTLTEALSTAFLAVLQIAGPIIAILLLADIGLGLLTRVAPTINLFVLSFPVKIGLTLLLVGIAIPQISPMLAGLTDASVDAMRGIAGG